LFKRTLKIFPGTLSGGDLEVVLAEQDDEQEIRQDHAPEGHAEEGDVDVALGSRNVDARTTRSAVASGGSATCAC